MKTETLTIMLVDLVGSTPLVEQASRSQLVELMRETMEPIRRAVHDFGGRIVKFTGDGYLTTFHSASEALQAAAQLVESYTSQPILPTGMRIEGCRVILHTSDVIAQEDDLLGEGVVIVARLEKHVPPNTVYLTSTVREVAKTSEFQFESVGDLLLRGLSNPVKVYKLLVKSFDGIERDTYLTVTDLLGMSHYLTEAPVEMSSRVLQRWVTLQRDALTDRNSRLRSIVGDNLVTTHESADDAVHALLQLEKLVAHHNETRGDLPRFEYTAITCKGDLFVLSLGVNGPLVSRAFRTLDHVERGGVALEPTVFDALTEYKPRFVSRTTEDGHTFYYLQPE